MRLLNDRPRRPYDSIVPLINLSFLLLVYFLMVGRYDATAPFEVMPPISVAGDDMPAGGTTVSLSPDGRLAIDGEEVDAQRLPERLRAAIAVDPGRAFVRLNADATARVQATLALIETLERAGAAEVALVVAAGR